MSCRKRVRFLPSVFSVGAVPSETTELAAADGQQEQEDYLLSPSRFTSGGKILKCGVHFGVNDGKHSAFTMQLCATVLCCSVLCLPSCCAVLHCSCIRSSCMHLLLPICA